MFDVQRKNGWWYARDVFALLAHSDISPDLRAQLEAWVRINDVNVQTRRPFAVGPDGLYTFDGQYRATHGAPAWWVTAWKDWAARTGRTT